MSEFTLAALQQLQANDRQLDILRHSLGLDALGRGTMYRNHFCAGGDDVVTCRELVALGLMIEHRPSDMTGGDPLFTVTDAGRALLRKAR